MQCYDSEKVLEANAPNLKELDAALKGLGMLATTTNSRNEYMKEISNNPCSSSLKINTRYVSNVSIGFKVKSMTPHLRYKPYLSKVRNRTKSENNDNENLEFIQNMLNSCMKSVEEITQLKKAKSLESIVSESNQNVDFNRVNFEDLPELEIVSDCIQNLKVVE
ncbi:hypothetical protein HHI36_015541 [Cryptolaemus montrouzieri]|uniref:Uncharacterized protein n=1 Tax=Cryptolaemus montrouzieri TaxID=559131 RepID=A0ABD2N613_9CUCU